MVDLGTLGRNTRQIAISAHSAMVAVRRERNRSLPSHEVNVMAETKTPIGGYVTAAVVGAIFVAIVGQFWPGYQLDSNAKEAVTKAVDTALKPVATDFLSTVCVQQAQADPEMAAKLEVINAAPSYEKNGKFRQTGWADIPGYDLSAANKSLLVNDCQKLLFPPAEATNTTPG